MPRWRLLQQEAGKALDPTVVRHFIEALPTLQAEAALLEQHPPSGGGRCAREPGAPAPGLAPEAQKQKKNVFDDIALAHREIYALYEIAQAMGTSLGVADTMALISRS
jgi:hypothetical protein